MVEPKFEPPCPIAQQMLGVLFGFMLGLTAQVLVGTNLICLFFVSFGCVFGILGSAVANPIEIRPSEFIKLGSVVYVFSIGISILLFSIIDSIAGIMLLSIVCSSFASVVRNMFGRQAHPKSNELSVV